MKIMNGSIIFPWHRAYRTSCQNTLLAIHGTAHTVHPVHKKAHCVSGLLDFTAWVFLNWPKPLEKPFFGCLSILRKYLGNRSLLGLLFPQLAWPKTIQTHGHGLQRLRYHQNL